MATQEGGTPDNVRWRPVPAAAARRGFAVQHCGMVPAAVPCASRHSVAQADCSLSPRAAIRRDAARSVGDCVWQHARYEQGSR